MAILQAIGRGLYSAASAGASGLAKGSHYLVVGSEYAKKGCKQFDDTITELANRESLKGIGNRAGDKTCDFVSNAYNNASDYLNSLKGRISDIKSKCSESDPSISFKDKVKNSLYVLNTRVSKSDIVNHKSSEMVEFGFE